MVGGFFNLHRTAQCFRPKQVIRRVDRVEFVEFGYLIALS